VKCSLEAGVGYHFGKLITVYNQVPLLLGSCGPSHLARGPVFLCVDDVMTFFADVGVYWFSRVFIGGIPEGCLKKAKKGRVAPLSTSFDKRWQIVNRHN
jgi:hypothetical protein